MKKLTALILALAMLTSAGCSSGGGSSEKPMQTVTVSQTKYKEERAEKPQGFGSLGDMAYI